MKRIWFTAVATIALGLGFGGAACQSSSSGGDNTGGGNEPGSSAGSGAVGANCQALSDCCTAMSDTAGSHKQECQTALSQSEMTGNPETTCQQILMAYQAAMACGSGAGGSGTGGTPGTGGSATGGTPGTGGETTTGGSGGTPSTGGTSAGGSGTGGDTGTAGTGGSSSTCTPYKLHPADPSKGNTLYCPFSMDPTTGKAQYCNSTMGEHCCQGPKSGTVSACEPSGTACMAMYIDWHCEDPMYDCTGGQVCCMQPEAGMQLMPTVDSTCTTIMRTKIFNVGGTTCAASCDATTELQVCEADSECPTGMHCEPVSAKGNQIGICQM